MRERTLLRGRAGWPERFEHLQQPPQRIWIAGSARPRLPAVAVVGSRLATPAGVDIARSIGRGLAGAGAQVISGMARGIDGAAHHGAVDGGGETIAVLGCGIDVCYPAEHARLRRAILTSGCVISEEPPGTPPLKHHFPKRNRLIAALAQAVVVVEATPNSGALSTARWAVDLGREVLAVPGSIRSPQSEGTNLLIRDGARPYLGFGDLLDALPELGPLLPLPIDAKSAEQRISHRLAPELAEILTRMGSTPVLPDELAATLGLSAAVVASRLGSLELEGAILSLPGGRVARTF
ncbi:MAG: DNA-protecting protein DprA [Candidatus Dormibacteraeota bacterium]|nr:DNA-protecting protein DprA [Candidatus Dormibacteraeota bacterium]